MNELQYQTLADVSPVGSFHADEQGQYLYVNTRWCQMAGLSSKAAIGNGWMQALHPDDRQRVSDAWSRVVQQHRPHFQMECRFQGPDCGVTWIFSQAMAEHDSEGRIRGYIGATTDITERKRTEQALQRQHGYLRLLKTAAVAANEATEVGQALSIILKEICLHTGWPVGHVYLPAAEVPGELVPTKIWHMEDPQKFKTFRRVTEASSFMPGEDLPGRVLASRRPAWIVDVARDANFPRAKLARDIGVRAGFGFPVLVGSEVGAVLEFFSTESVEPDGDLLEIIANVGTQLGRVIERSRSDQAIRKNEQRLRAIFDHAAVGVAHVDVQGRFLKVNRKLCEILGYDADELGQMTCFDVLAPDEKKPCQEIMASLLNHQAEVVPAEKRFIKKDGSVAWTQWTVAVARPEGEPEYFVPVIEDITTRKAAQEQARRHQAELAHVTRLSAVGELASGLAHEINQPLSAISNYLAVCAHELKTGDWDRGAFLGVIDKASVQCHRASEILHRLRSFVTRQEPKRSPVDVNQLVRETIELVEADVRSSKTKIVLDLCRRAVWVEADGIQIEQVILNLILNSLEAMRETQGMPRRLTIKTKLLGSDAVEMTLQDTAGGLSERDLDNIFEPFFTTKSSGMGLGLSISRSIVEAHGGKITANLNPDCGITFKMILPTMGLAETNKVTAFPKRAV